MLIRLTEPIKNREPIGRAAHPDQVKKIGQLVHASGVDRPIINSVTAEPLQDKKRPLYMKDIFGLIEHSDDRIALAIIDPTIVPLRMPFKPVRPQHLRWYDLP